MNSSRLLCVSVVLLLIEVGGGLVGLLVDSSVEWFGVVCCLVNAG